jgi:signal-transduction protein with cAMP-binding, CBS, and nucleotidyltransferase domain
MNDKVQKIMVKNVVTCDPGIPITKAAKTMKSKKIGSLVVLKSGKTVGLVTAQDITYRAVAESMDIIKTPVEKIMTSKLTSVKSSDLIYHANKVLETKKIRKLPIIDNGKLMGIVTQTDVLNYFAAKRKKLAVADFGNVIKSS